jgi:predicted DNA-binding protein (UPF0251 family)
VKSDILGELLTKNRTPHDQHNAAHVASCLDARSLAHGSNEAFSQAVWMTADHILTQVGRDCQAGWLGWWGLGWWGWAGGMYAQSGNVPFYQSYNVPCERDVEMDLLTMSPKEVNRLEVVQRVDEKRMKQKAAAELLGISERQVKRLVRRYRKQGASGLVSQRRGKPSSHQLADDACPIGGLQGELVRPRDGNRVAVRRADETDHPGLVVVGDDRGQGRIEPSACLDVADRDVLEQQNGEQDDV